MGKLKKSETRDKIVATAKKLFIKKGLAGVRMRELAEKAGVNKGLLHYYFKKKEAIFLEIFASEVEQLYSHINEILSTEMTFEEKIGLIVDEYFNLLQKNPGMPGFVLSEIAKNPDFLPSKIQHEIGTTLAFLQKELGVKGKKGPQKAMSFLLTIISLCIFPFIAQPLLQRASKLKKEEVVQFILGRKEYIKSILIKSLEL